MTPARRLVRGTRVRHVSTTRPAARAPTVSAALVELMAQLGATHAYGLLGGAIAPLYDALGAGNLRLVHCRHESGAAFAAVETYFAGGGPGVVFVTTGPGITNALTGIAAARCEGAKLVVLAGATPAAKRSRGAFQQTAPHGIGVPFAAGELFHWATTVEDPAELPSVARRLAEGLAGSGGFVAGVALPTGLQLAPAPPLPRTRVERVAPGCDETTLAACARRLSEADAAILVGFGARDAAPAIRELAERTGAAVACTPRGKGIFPEDHPQFLGVTGIGAHDSVGRGLACVRPHHLLVLGSRLGELSSFWERDLVPPGGLIHVDVDPAAFGAAYPAAPAIGIQSEIGAFVRGLLPHLGPARRPTFVLDRPRPSVPPGVAVAAGPIHPATVFAAVQRVVVDGSDAVVLVEAGNAFAWGAHALCFRSPGRFRVSVGFGSMGHASSGVLGAALAREGPAVAIVGDGAMLMMNELGTAVAQRVAAIWVVLNDGGYGMTEHGMRAVGFSPVGTRFTEVDFAALARAVGARAVRVERAEALDAALAAAMAAGEPFVVDVVVDRAVPSPGGRRNRSLLEQFQSSDDASKEAP